MTFWDQQYASPAFKYGTQPNRFLAEQAARLLPQSAVLLPGDGEGRNSVWLAGQGHRPTAVDNSAVGLQKALGLAAQHKVDIATVLADLETWAPAPASFDALVVIYAHLPAIWRAQALQRLVQGLRPGGWLILEAFHPQQLGYRSGGPKDATMLYTVQTMRSDLATASLQEVMAWEGEVQLDEGSGHQGPAYVTRYIAQRAASL